MKRSGLFRYVFQLKDFLSDLGKRSWKPDGAFPGSGAMAVEDVCRKYGVPMPGPVCHLVTASGAEWSCYGKGYAELVEANGLPYETAVGELLDCLELPRFLVFADMVDEFSVVGHLVHAAVFTGCVFVGEFQKSCYGKSDEGCSCRYQGVSGGCHGDAKKEYAG